MAHGKVERGYILVPPQVSPRLLNGLLKGLTRKSILVTPSVAPETLTATVLAISLLVQPMIDRYVSQALKAYAMLAASADKGAVRQLPDN